MSYQEFLQCHGISVSGLNPADQQRIEQIGLSGWLDEVAGATESQPMPKEKVAAKRHRLPCNRCGTAFLSRRADAQFCSQKCQKRFSGTAEV